MSTVHPDYRTEDGMRQLWLNPLTGATELVPNEYALDDRDRDILRARFNRFNEVSGPRVGDFVRFADGTERRFAHDWDEDGLQVNDPRFGGEGSFYFGDGYCSFSGALAPCIKREELHWFTEVKEGRVWFFHHDHAGAGRGVPAFIPFRVYETDEKVPA